MDAMNVLSSGGNVALIVLGFCLLIALHELGHFLAARWAGIRVHVFAIGMGPVLCSWRKGVGFRFGSTERTIVERHGTPAFRMSDAQLAAHGLSETEYSLRILPIGGFVGMLGQDDLDPSARSDDPRSYQRVSVGKRMVVISAGVIANVILAIVLFMVAFMVGVRFEAPVIGDVMPAGAAARATPADLGAGAKGLLPGDRVLSIDGTRAQTFADVRIAAAMSKPGVPLTFEIEREGVDRPLFFDVLPRDVSSGLRSLDAFPAVSCTIDVPKDPAEFSAIERVLEQAGLAAHGVRPGWRLIEVDGEPAIYGNDLTLAALRSDGTPLRTRWRSPDGTKTAEAPIEVVPAIVTEARTSKDGAARPPEAHVFGLTPLVEITHLEPDSPNASVLQKGDVILAAGSVVAPTRDEVVEVVRASRTSTVTLRILRDGREMTVDATVASSEIVGDRPRRLGVLLAPALATARMAKPTGAEWPASALSIEPGSSLVAIDGSPVGDWSQARRALDHALRSGLARHEQTITIAIAVRSPTPGATPEIHRLEIPRDQAEAFVALGWQPALQLAVFEPHEITLSAEGNPFRAVAMGFRQTWSFMLLTYLTIDRLARGTVSVSELHGPIGIVHLGSRVADRGLTYLVFFLAMISVNLAVLNFLPIPIVDGGQFLFLVYEKLRGRQPSVAFQNATFLLGIVLIVGIFIVASYNDVMRLIGRG